VKFLYAAPIYCRQTLSETSSRLRHHQIVTYIVTSSLRMYYIIFSAHSTKSPKQKSRWTHKIFFRKVAYSRYDVNSEMFRTDTSCLAHQTRVW
jgi:hypothetical protein